MTKLSESIIGKIKEEDIKLIPKWHFLAKNYIFWCLFVISLILGSFAFSVVVHIVNASDLDLLDHLSGNILSSSIMMLPFVWVVTLILFAFISYVNWVHTKHGYRINRLYIFVCNLVLSFIFGALFYYLGLGKYMDLLMVKSVPFYSKTKHVSRIKLWQQPEKGLIIGRICDYDSDKKSFTIEDGDGNLWQIGNNVQNKTKSELNEIIKDGEIVKIIGSEKGDKNEFVAKDIRTCKDCDGDSDDYGGPDTDNDND